MNRLIAELQRLYFLPGQLGQAGPTAAALTPEMLAQSLTGEARVALDPVGPDDRARALALDFARSADWEEVARLCQAIQEDLDLPAPAVSVSGKDGYRLWFSLAEPVPLEQAQRFLEALRRRYLADIPPARLAFRPQAGEPGVLDLVPALDRETGKWSAFIDPAMGSMFAAEPGLEMAPNLDKQADLLAGFESIKAGDFQRALDALQSPAETADSPAPAADSPRAAAGGQETLKVGSGFKDPKSFLLAVMNDPSASAELRIEAAKALLPYFEAGAGK